MSPLNEILSEEIIREIKDEFLETFQERIDALNNGLLEIENNSKNIEVLKDVYRTLHNIKGTAGTLGFDEISIIAHRMEDIISINLDSPDNVVKKLDLLYKDIDRMSELVLLYKEGKEIRKDINEKGIVEDRKYVMIIEFSKVIRNTIINKLKNKYSILISDDPIEALKRIILEPVTLLITSKELEYIDGITLIKIIKDIPFKSNIKTILLTSNDVNSNIPDFIIKKDSKFLEKFENIIKEI
ncbi:MAG TPA: Hpt domain-containing protein [Spirochaetota bacterium]|nr:Hpt domain-containing protein [Spirochaetota bacterium]HOM37879.1 Hpt domain-containing protein [Spirochaetota bacterium]HPQ48683.1 Hpt domain-containing protein [Spirochaetota bacterium]